MNSKKSISDYTESEFLALVRLIFDQNENPMLEAPDAMLEHFVSIVEHPSSADLIYHCSEEDYSPEAVTRIIKKWYSDNSKPCFKLN